MNDEPSGATVMTDSGADFIAYLQLQGDLEMFTKTELFEYVRQHTGTITQRRLTSYITEGLVPKSARIGSRSAAYPKIVGNLVVWITQARKRGMSVEAIREVLPLWRFVMAGRRDKCIDLGAFERLARDELTSPEAAYAVPAVLMGCLPCPHCGADDLRDIKYVMKDGTIINAGEDPVSVGFLIAEVDETGEPRKISSYRAILPYEDEGDEPSTIVLGIPNGVELTPSSCAPPDDSWEFDIEGDAEPETLKKEA